MLFRDKLKGAIQLSVAPHTAKTEFYKYVSQKSGSNSIFFHNHVIYGQLKLSLAILRREVQQNQKFIGSML